MVKFDRAYFEKLVDEADITNDRVFGKVMSKKKNCLPLLQRILPEKNITDLKYVKTQERMQRHPGQRGVILDVYAEGKDGKQVFDVEMQTTSSHNLGKRMLLYLCYMIGHQLRPGQTEDDIKENYVIFICKFDYFHRKQYKYEFNNIPSDVQTDLVLPTGTHFIVFNVYGQQGDVGQSMKNFLKLAAGEQQIDDEYVKQIQQEVQDLKTDKVWREVLMMDSETLYKEGRTEGQKEARVEDIGKLVKIFLAEGYPKEKVWQLLQNQYGDVMSKDHLKQLLEDNY